MATATATSCQTCSSELRPNDERHLPACCGSPICGACLARNPRLRSYVPCLRCGDVRSAEGAAEVARGARLRAEETRRGEEVFVLEDSDEEGDGAEVESKPPPEKVESPTPAVPQAEPEPRKEIESKHLVARGDTLQSIARKYATDPHTLLTLNNLPHAALHANPAILRTRTEIVISRRTIGTDGAADDDETAERAAQRALKRFQVVSKEADRGVAAAYLALAGGGEGSGWDRGGGGGEKGGGEQEKERGARGGSEKEKSTPGPTSALDAYFDDEEWERAAPRPEKGKIKRWTVVGVVLPPGAGKA